MVFAFKVEVLEKKKIITDVFLFTLSAPKDFKYEPGQFIILAMEKEGEKKPRAYSILRTEKGKIILCIRLIKGGFASGIFAQSKKGDLFEAKGPFGNFVLDEKDKNEEIWLLGGGTGLVPLYNIIMEKAAIFPPKNFFLLYSAWNQENLLFRRELEKWQKKQTNFKYLPTLTREKWKSRTGRIQANLPNSLENKTFYICGSKGLVEDVEEHLLKKGVKPSNIKYEKY